MHRRERLAQGASQVIATLVSLISTTKGQGSWKFCGWGLVKRKRVKLFSFAENENNYFFLNLHQLDRARNLEFFDNVPSSFI